MIFGMGRVFAREGKMRPCQEAKKVLYSHGNTRQSLYKEDADAG